MEVGLSWLFLPLCNGTEKLNLWVDYNHTDMGAPGCFLLPSSLLPLPQSIQQVLSSLMKTQLSGYFCNLGFLVSDLSLQQANQLPNSRHAFWKPKAKTCSRRRVRKGGKNKLHKTELWWGKKGPERLDSSGWACSYDPLLWFSWSQGQAQFTKPIVPGSFRNKKCGHKSSNYYYCCCCSVTKLCLTLWNPMD